MTKKLNFDRKKILFFSIMLLKDYHYKIFLVPRLGWNVTVTNELFNDSEYHHLHQIFSEKQLFQTKINRIQNFRKKYFSYHAITRNLSSFDCWYLDNHRQYRNSKNSIRRVTTSSNRWRWKHKIVKNGLICFCFRGRYDVWITVVWTPKFGKFLNE